MRHALVCLMFWGAPTCPSTSMLAHNVYISMKPCRCTIAHQTRNFAKFTKCYCPLLFYACLCYCSILIIAKYKLLCICCYICLVCAFLELWFVNRPIQHNGPNRLWWTKPSLPIQYSYSTFGPFQEPMISHWVWAWEIVLKKGPHKVKRAFCIQLNWKWKTESGDFQKACLVG